MLNLLLTAALQTVVTPPTTTEIWFALTKSGVRIESVEHPQAGDLVVATPFGVFNTPTDPVATSFRGRAGNWRDYLDYPDQSLLAEEVAAMSANGRLSELVAICNTLLARGQTAITLQAVKALESWGERIDRIEPKLGFEQRIERLWELVNSTSDATALLSAGALYAEAEPINANTGFGRNLSLRELNRGLKHRSPIVQRSAARLAAKQRVSDPALIARLLDGSVGGGLLVRDACAEAAESCWGSGTVSWWTVSLLRSSDSKRMVMAENLYSYAPEDGLRPLVFIVAASGKKSGKQFDFDTRTIRMVRDSLSNSISSPRSLCASCSSGGVMLPWGNPPLSSGSVERIRKVAPELAASVLAKTIQLLGLPRESSREQVLQAWAERR